MSPHGAAAALLVVAALPDGLGLEVPRLALRPTVAARAVRLASAPQGPPVAPGDEVGPPVAAPRVVVGDEAGEAPVERGGDPRVPLALVPVELGAATAGAALFGLGLGYATYELFASPGDGLFDTAIFAFMAGVFGVGVAPAGAALGAYVAATTAPDAEPRLLWTMVGAYGASPLALGAASLMVEAGADGPALLLPFALVPIGATLGAHLGAGDRTLLPDGLVVPREVYDPADEDEDEEDEDDLDEDASRLLPRTRRARGVEARALVVPLLRLSF